MSDETKFIDNWECPWCGSVNVPSSFQGTPDYSTEFTANCPSCNNEVNVMPSVEFTCSPVLDGDQ